MRYVCLSVVMSALFLLPFVPVLVADIWIFPFITGKNFTFRILVEIAFVGWATLALIDKSHRPRFSWILVSLLTLCGIMLVANLLGEYPVKSFWSVFERMDGYVTLVHLVLLVIVLGSVLKDKRIKFLNFKTTAWQLFFGTILIASVLVVFKAAGQLAGTEVITQGETRINSTLGNAAYMAVYMLFMFFIAALAIVKSRSSAWQITYGVLAIIFATLLFLTATRGTVLGFIGGVILFTLIVIFFERRAVRLRSYAIYGIVVICLLIGGLWMAKDTTLIQGSTVAKRLTTGISLSAMETRFTIWGIATDGFKERPLLGWGQGNFDYAFNQYYRPSLYNVEPWYDRAHNILFDWLIAGGILGALAYLSVLLAVLYYLVWRVLIKKDETFTVIEVAVLTGLLASYFVHNLVVFDNIVSYLFFAIILAYIHSKVATPVKAIAEFEVSLPVATHVIAPSACLLLGLIIYFINVPGMIAASAAIDVARARTPAGLISASEAALAGNTFSNQEIRSFLVQQAPKLLANPQFTDEDKAALRAHVESEMLKQIENKPGDAKTHVVLASFYLQTRQIEKAREQFGIAREISPLKPSIIIYQGSVEYQSADYEAAHTFFAEAYQLAPEYDWALTLYFTTLLLTNQKDEAITLLDSLKDEEVINLFDNNKFILEIAKTSGYHDILKRLFKTKLTVDPNDSEARLDLATTHYDLDEKAEAISLLKEAVDSILDFAETGESAIKNIEAGRQPRDDGTKAAGKNTPAGETAAGVTFSPVKAEANGTAN